MQKVYIFDFNVKPNLFKATFLDRDSDDLIEFKIGKDCGDGVKLHEFLSNDVAALIGFDCFLNNRVLHMFMLNSSLSSVDLYNYYDEVREAKYKKKDLSIYPEIKANILDLYTIHHLYKKERKTELEWVAFQINSLDINNNCQTIKKLYIQSLHMVELRKRIIKGYKISSQNHINWMNYSDMKLGSEMLLSIYSKKLGVNPFEIRQLRTNRSEVKGSDIIKIDYDHKIEEFRLLKEAIKRKVYTDFSNPSDVPIVVNFKGIELSYGMSGVRGSVHDTIIEESKDYSVFEVDATSNHAHIVTNLGLHPAHLGPEICSILKEGILDVRLAELTKPEPDFGLIKAYKEVLLAATGNGKNSHSWMYDPLYYLQVVVNSELLINVLIERLVLNANAKIIKVNTDSVMFMVDPMMEQVAFGVNHTWELEFNMKLKKRQVKKALIKNTNDNIIDYYDNSVECKGIYNYEPKELHENNSNAISRRAVYEYFINGTSIEETIKNSKDIYEFLIGARCRPTSAGKPWHELHYIKDNKIQKDRYDGILRYFVSNNGDILVRRTKGEKETIVEKKFKNSYKSTLLMNINESKDISEYNIDYMYYIRCANELIQGFNFNQMKLF